jgi:AcrR family transcriptional regulator
MPRSAERHAQRRAERRRAILAAAVPLFARDGFADTPVSAVARAAGVAHGTVFLHFPTKAALFAAAVTEPLREIERAMLVAQEGLGPAERLRLSVPRHLEFILQRREYLRLAQFVLGHRDRFPDLAGELFAFAGRFCEAVAQLLREGQRRGEVAAGEPAMLARAYFAYLNGLGLVHVGGDDREFWGAMARLGQRLLGLDRAGEGTRPP